MLRHKPNPTNIKAIERVAVSGVRVLRERSRERVDNNNRDVLGCNCSVGPVAMLDAIERIRQATTLPLSAQPNAVVIIASATLVLGITTPKRPAYCPLPENVTFDRTEHPELIGLYTGSWTPTTDIGILFVRKFCILLTSIREMKSRGFTVGKQVVGMAGPVGESFKRQALAPFQRFISTSQERQPS